MTTCLSFDPPARGWRAYRALRKLGWVTRRQALRAAWYGIERVEVREVVAVDTVEPSA